MEQKKLMSNLKSGEFASCYLLYGVERYLVSFYAKEIEKSLGVDKDVFFQNPVAEIIMAAETLPFFAERRLILVQESKLFATGRKDDSEKMTNYLTNIPSNTTIIFTESDVDRRSKLFKQISKVGAVLECSPPSSQDLATWVLRLAKEKDANIAPATAHQLVRIVGANMTQLSNEISKLAAYCEGGEISVDDINLICTPTLESKIFDMTKAMGSGRLTEALGKYHDMLMLKESPIMILTMIVRQFRMILLCKCAYEKGMTIFDTTKELGFRDFMVSEALSQARRYSTETLLQALRDCLDTDVKIKTGLISQELGVELLIVKYGK